jgi:hypothetical protein
MIGQNLFDAFARSYDAPHWIIEALQRDAPVGVRSELNAALESVPQESLVALDKDERAQCDLLFTATDPELRARLFVVSHEAAQLIERTRLRLAAQIKVAPYDHPALRDVDIDDEGLVPLSAFVLEGDALCVNGHAFFAFPPVPGSNASYWLLQEFQRCDLLEAVRVRLDPLLHGSAEELRGRFYRASVYGRTLDWERIGQLRVVEHGRWIPGRLSRAYLLTDYAWVPHQREVDFHCEELPIAEEIAIRGSRYLHAIYNKNRHQITHLDGAIRIMTPTQLATRADGHVRNSGKVGTRVKTFRTDRPIEPDTLGGIAQAFFFWNYDVARYFGASVHPDL